MIHTGGEQIQGNETRNFTDQGPRIGEKRGRWASWTAQALFAWTGTHDEPRKSGSCGYMAAGLLTLTHNFRDRGPRIGEKRGRVGKLDSTSSLRLDKDPRWAREVRDVRLYSCWSSARADVSSRHRTPAWFWTVGAKASHGNGRLLDACFRVFARCAKKKIFNSFTSFSRWKRFIAWKLRCKLDFQVSTSVKWFLSFSLSCARTTTDAMPILRSFNQIFEFRQALLTNTENVTDRSQLCSIFSMFGGLSRRCSLMITRSCTRPWSWRTTGKDWTSTASTSSLSNKLGELKLPGFSKKKIVQT